MASTGVSVSDAAIADYNEFKKQSNSLKFIIFKIEKGSIVKDISSDSSLFDDFLEKLPADDGRYAVYKMDFKTNDGRDATKLVSISWAPDSASVKTKMIYAGSKDALSRVLVGVSVKIGATDLSEVSYEIIETECKKF